ncbi:MAG: hypothetical protein CME65_08795 [Halobacteriovoraceae bacterium]|nr:hypothetical protein [Halobacteriovoraceae bacterium]|tara:strand:+ start:1431 stop:2327 length:897 start_codon:yes stop_codon:yes gene_type:complete
MIDKKVLLAIVLLLFFSLGIIDMVKADCDPTWTKIEWKNYIRNQLDSKVSNSGLKNNEAVLNALITESYANLISEENELNELNLIGYFYSHASFHLGRIARYRFWPKGDQRGVEDKNQITGRALRRILSINSSFASKKLMHYSEKLYYHLTWSLVAYKECGLEYTLARVRDENLYEFYQSSFWPIKLEAFVTYEQSFLQENLYQDNWVAPLVKLGVIDEMRWIPFPGERGQNFKQWCELSKCRKSSFDLALRIKFDTETLLKEVERIEDQGFFYRYNSSSVLENNRYFISLIKDDKKD